MRRLAGILGFALCAGSGAALAEEIPGFHPGFWAFMEKADPTEAEIADLCRRTLVIVTPPNNAQTLAFQAIDKPEAEGGKRLRGELIYVENCPDIAGSSVTCAGRSPADKAILPTLFTYAFRKLPDGRYEIRAKSRDTEEVLYVPRLCPRNVIEELKQTAIMPEGVSLAGE
jgi:hypothetical protein